METHGEEAKATGLCTQDGLAIRHILPAIECP
jgi:hypothetical protein